jgi:hypothetical protein
MWKTARWTDESITEEELFGGTRVRLTFPDGSVIVGKVTVAPNLISGGPGRTMVRVSTVFSGDTWVDAEHADVEVWESTAFEPG